jgi:hypothetical protein
MNKKILMALLLLGVMGIVMSPVNATWVVHLNGHGFANGTNNNWYLSSGAWNLKGTYYYRANDKPDGYFFDKINSYPYLSSDFVFNNIAKDLVNKGYAYRDSSGWNSNNYAIVFTNKSTSNEKNGYLEYYDDHESGPDFRIKITIN